MTERNLRRSRQHLIDVLAEKPRDPVEVTVERLRAELAEGVTEIRLRLAFKCAKADTAATRPATRRALADTCRDACFDPTPRQ